MKTTLHHCIFMPYEVEVPDTCPKCGADFIGEASKLIQWTYEPHGWWAKIVADEGRIEDVNIHRGDWDTTFAQGLKCGACNHIIDEGQIIEVNNKAILKEIQERFFPEKK